VPGPKEAVDLLYSWVRLGGDGREELVTMVNMDGGEQHEEAAGGAGGRPDGAAGLHRADGSIPEEMQRRDLTSQLEVRGEMVGLTPE
jgi:hypothetical protein